MKESSNGIAHCPMSSKTGTAKLTFVLSTKTTDKGSLKNMLLIWKWTGEWKARVGKRTFQRQFCVNDPSAVLCDPEQWKAASVPEADAGKAPSQQLWLWKSHTMVLVNQREPSKTPSISIYLACLCVRHCIWFWQIPHHVVINRRETPGFQKYPHEEKREENQQDCQRGESPDSTLVNWWNKCLGEICRVRHRGASEGLVSSQRK